MNTFNVTVKENASRKVTIRFTPTEYTKLYTAFRQTTKRKISEYLRAVLLEKPVTVYTRSRSLDAFINEIIRLRQELAAVGNNFNQAVKRLHVLSYTEEVKKWTVFTENLQQNVSTKVNAINQKIAQISDTWLSESAQ
jgi:hypothetical protein